ncbi:hypothetical protein DL98DRAFT_654341 [Cadophora sp. DSE1049]|nr:hypothetical protein DL98DRAFT_654341 [Cadophora sp. DSE1049]
MIVHKQNDAPRQNSPAIMDTAMQDSTEGALFPRFEFAPSPGFRATPVPVQTSSSTLQEYIVHLGGIFESIERLSTVTTSRHNSTEEEGSSPTNTNPSTLDRDTNSPRMRTPLPNGRRTSNDPKNSDSQEEISQVNDQKASESQQETTQLGFVMEGSAQSDLAGQTTSIVPLRMQERPKRKRKASKRVHNVTNTLDISVTGKAPKSKSSATGKAPNSEVKAAGGKSKFFSEAAKRAKIEGDVPLNENEEVQKAVKQADLSDYMALDISDEVLQAADTLMFMFEGGHPADRKLAELYKDQRLREHGHETAITLTNLWIYLPITDKMARQEASTGMSLPNTRAPNWRTERRTDGVADKEGGKLRRPAKRRSRAKSTFKDDSSNDTVSNASDDEENNIPVESASSDIEESEALFVPPQPKVHKTSSSKANAGAGRGQRISR